jgi:hypothetical protein
MEHDDEDCEHVVAETRWRQASGAIFLTVALAVLLAVFVLAG